MIFQDNAIFYANQTTHVNHSIESFDHSDNPVHVRRLFAYFVIQLKDSRRNAANFFSIHPYKRVKHVNDGMAGQAE